MLSDQSSIGDSNRAETDGAGRLGDGSAPAAFRPFFALTFDYSKNETLTLYCHILYIGFHCT